jgi:hypothetical protein
MMRAFILLTIMFVIVFTISAQVKTVTKPSQKTWSKSTNLGIGCGVSRSVLFLTRNVKENNDATGYNATIIYGGERLFRGSLEYTFYQPIDIKPTWLDIKAHTLELNMHVIARFKNVKAYFYPLFGISYNSFSGYFTGLNDFLNLKDDYGVNQVVNTRWLGLNVGTGYEIYIKNVSVFADYKMRVGNSERLKQLNIMDVCFTGGLRYNLKVPSIYKLFRGTRGRYILD